MIEAALAIGLVLVGVLHVQLRARQARRDREVRAALEALGRRGEAHDSAITTLGRAVAALAPSDARPTRPNAPPSRPYRPTPAEVASARAAYSSAPPSAAARIERAVLPEPPVDTTGDRSGLVPDPPSAMPSPWPPADERDSSEEFTRVMSSADASRAADNARRAIRPPPYTRPPIDLIEARYQELRAVARAAGETCDHCHAADCCAEEQASPCTCPCRGCRRARELLQLAGREVMGAPP